MKTFQQYLAESVKTYDYRIKICGDVPPSFVDQLKDKLEQFDIVNMSKPKTTPIQTLLKDFPNERNQSLTFIDVNFRYPAIDPQIKQLSQLLGFDPNKICLVTKKYDDSVNKEIADIESQNKDLIADTDYPSPDSDQKDLSADYSAPADQHAVLQNAYKSEFTVAGGKTAKAKTTNDLPQGIESPMSKINRPSKPATGANPKG